MKIECRTTGSTTNEVIKNKYVWYAVIASLDIFIGLTQILYVRGSLILSPRP